jgi:signal transduction histidine kinase
MKPREAVQNRSQSAGRQWTTPWRLALAVAPIAVVSVVLALLLGWNLVSSDSSSTWNTVAAVAVVVFALTVAAGTIAAMYRSGRTMARRIGEVSAAVRRVARRDLVEVLDALRNPDADLDAIAPMSLDTSSDDEVGDLSRSLEELHGSLVEVGARQMEAMRAGVSSILATLARRNSSLVDRQLALLDGLESREEDPEVLGSFYQLDHLATRMRRNAESLLVLAGSESPRVWAKATDMSDVVRAAVSEIDEYQRIEVLALEPARLSGGAVSDVTHLVAELLENAIQFSPPSEQIRVTGLFAMDGYQLAISDRGVGMSEARMAEMNRILDRPPALGLSVEPTLGMYVIAKLAHRHGLDVELIRAVPGITARITIPRDHLEVEKETATRPWDPEHRERVAAESAQPTVGPEHRDTETRQYVASRAEDASGRDHVIDLTAPGYAEPDLDRPATELPRRRPGTSFSGDDDGSDAVSPGEGASRIQSALSAYDRGRRSAVDAEEAGPMRFWNESEDEESS